MAMTLDEFTGRLVESRLVTRPDIESAIRVLVKKGTARDPEHVARVLVRRGLLTAYQAKQIYRGEGRHLVLGNYVVLDKLGQGGMGLVLKARHRRMNRIVALKVLSPAVTTSPSAVARFQREVRAAARLSHPNIVAAYDADEADGTHFLVLEYVPGTDLSARVRKQGALSVEQAIDCILQAARGLAYAHEQGVIHRDIKPGNLLWDSGGVIKILDMGLARVDAGDCGESSQEELTTIGQIMGTIDFMAPEQARDTKMADLRADIYSLGVTLWYLLVGRVMYEGSSSVQKLMAHQTRAIPSLSEACPEAGGALESIFARMVAKLPDERYSSVQEVIDDLERLRDGSAPAPALLEFPDEDRELHDFFRGMDESGGGVAVASAARVRHEVKPALKATVSVIGPVLDTDPAIERPALSSIRRLKTRRPTWRGWLERLRVPRSLGAQVVLAVAAAIGLMGILGILLLLVSG